MDCGGARDWFEKFSAERGFPEDLNQAISLAIQSNKSLPQSILSLSRYVLVNLKKMG